MKKILSIALALILALGIFSISMATDVQYGNGYTSIIDNTTCSNVTTDFNTSGVITLMNKRTSFFVTTLETNDGAANVTVALAPQISQDNSTWINVSFYDNAGGSTLQTIENITGNGTYLFWVPETIVAPYMRVSYDEANTSATNTTNIKTYIAGSLQ